MNRMREDDQPCVVCGHEGHDVKGALIRWRDSAEHGAMFAFEPRCVDHEACRARVAALGEKWPIWDRKESAA